MRKQKILRSPPLQECCAGKIEDEIDMDLYHIAMKQHIANPQVVSFDEMMKEIDF